MAHFRELLRGCKELEELMSGCRDIRRDQSLELRQLNLPFARNFQYDHSMLFLRKNFICFETLIINLLFLY